jgi:hypothetical protein
LRENAIEKAIAVTGTRAIRLKQLVREVKNIATLDTFLESMLEDAHKVLTRLTQPAAQPTDPSAEEMVQLICDLLKSPSSEVKSSKSLGTLSRPGQVAELLEQHHAILYHHPTDMYRFYSPAFAMAAEKMMSPGTRTHAFLNPHFNFLIEVTNCYSLPPPSSHHPDEGFVLIL